MRVYVAGPMSGVAEWNFPAFHEAAARLRGLGFDVVNPAELDPYDHVPGSWEWDAYLRRDLRALLGCDGVALLPGWERSDGARLEHTVADRLGMDVRTVDEWEDTVGGDVRLVGLNGYARSGKDTAAQTLVAAGWKRLAFADVLKTLAAHVGWDGRKDERGRRFLEDLGAGARDVIDPDVWLWPVRKAIEGDPHARFVLTDMRYPNEAAMVRDLGGMTVQVVRPGCRPGGPSDTQLRGYRFDHVVANNGTVEELHGRVRAAVGLE